MIQARKYEKEQEEIKHIKEFIASCGTYANMMKQAKSKQKILDKMEAAGLTKPVESQVGGWVGVWGIVTHCPCCVRRCAHRSTRLVFRRRSRAPLEAHSL